MGGDYAPEQIVIGSLQAVKKYDCEIILVGDEIKIKEYLNTDTEWQKLP